MLYYDNLPDHLTTAWALVLNPMASRCEDRVLVVRSDARSDLEALLVTERVPNWQDGHWRKVFKKDGPLEWFNPPEGIDGERAGIFELRRDGWRVVT